MRRIPHYGVILYIRTLLPASSHVYDENGFSAMTWCYRPRHLCGSTGTLRNGMLEEGAYADLLIVDRNPLEDLAAIGAHNGWFEAPPRSRDVDSIRLIMKDANIYKYTL